MVGIRYVQSLSGWVIVGGHLCIIVYIFLGWRPEMDFDTRLSAALTICPVSAVYFLGVIKCWIDGKYLSGPGKSVNLNYAIVTIVIPIVLFILLIYTIKAYPQEGFVKKEQLQSWLAGIEIAFGGVMGVIVSDLFGKDTASESRS